MASDSLRDHQMPHRTTLGWTETLIWIFILFVALLGTSRVQDSAGWQAHTYDTIISVEQIYRYLLDAETGQRGFLLTGKDEYLIPYREAMPKIDKDLIRLHSMAKSEKIRQNLEEVKSHSRIKLDELERTIQLRGNSFEAAQEVVLTDQGRNEMDKIRKILSQIQDEEERLLREKNERFRQTSLELRIIITMGMAVAMLTVVVRFFLGPGSKKR